MDFSARFFINSMLTDIYLGWLVCHTGHAYSRTGLTTRMYTVINWVMPALFNWYNIHPFHTTYVSFQQYHRLSTYRLYPHDTDDFDATSRWNVVGLPTCISLEEYCLHLVQHSWLNNHHVNISINMWWYLSNTMDCKKNKQIRYPGEIEAHFPFHQSKLFCTYAHNVSQSISMHSLA